MAKWPETTVAAEVDKRA